ncbi:alpha/beta hydrolase [Halobacillus amylolyticus]|uniref:Alpha/beta hydrolase n=1 Tax=Halobacillus amylolyticus TaxID=2932259 RepID=A0ABY4HAW4_9BACI|nr:alpha/beta hydrolase [Halobacillus amylolyticus]UOR11085.1 alpha/beta hydrolase [Halobacillus amylolyticus]
MEIIQKEILTTINHSIPYTYVQKKADNNKICIMIPGLGYTTDQPLFYYATGLFLGKGFDILHINYKYDPKEFNELERGEKVGIIKEDVQSFLDQILPAGKYIRSYIIAKSIGTAALANELANRGELKNAKAIWLTPLLQVDYIFDHLINNKQQEGLVIIGDNDQGYIEERFSKLSGSENINSILVKGTNHSLEHKDGLYKSIDCLKEIIEEIDKFISIE